MTDDVLDALDRMIAGFGNPDFVPVVPARAPAGTKNCEDFHDVDRFGRFVPGDSHSMGKIHSQKNDSRADELVSLAGARVWKNWYNRYKPVKAAEILGKRRTMAA